MLTNKVKNNAEKTLEHLTNMATQQNQTAPPVLTVPSAQTVPPGQTVPLVQTVPSAQTVLPGHTVTLGQTVPSAQTVPPGYTVTLGQVTTVTVPVSTVQSSNSSNYNQPTTGQNQSDSSSHQQSVHGKSTDLGNLVLEEIKQIQKSTEKHVKNKKDTGTMFR